MNTLLMHKHATKLIGGVSMGLLTLAGAAGAQTTTQGTTSATSTATTTATTTPGVPNTGLGGDPMVTGLLLAASLFIALGGALYLYMRSRERVASQWE